MQLFVYYYSKLDFPGGSDGREFLQNAGDLSSIPGPGRSPGEENDYPLQNSCLKNPMDKGSWQACGKESATIEQLNTHTYKKVMNGNSLVVP